MILGEWKNVTEDLEKLLRLRTYPLALKFLEKAEDMDKIKKVRRPREKRQFCQILNMSRTLGWTIGVTADDFMPGASCAALLGLDERSEFIRSGSFRSILWLKGIENAKKFEDEWEHIPTGKYEAVVISPLSAEKFDPDMILVHGKPTQMALLMNGIQYENYEKLTFHFSGESSCLDSISQCYLTKKPSLTVPCWGHIRFGHYQEDELEMALPGDLELFKGYIRGLEALSNVGRINYPITPGGSDANLMYIFEQAYGEKI